MGIIFDFVPGREKKMRRFEIINNPQITALHTAFSIDLCADFRSSSMPHDFYEIVCIMEGTANISAGYNVFTLHKGQAVVHPPMQFHNIYTPANSAASVIIFTFSGQNIPDLYDRICYIDNVSKVKALYESAVNYYNRDGIWVEGLKENTIEHFKFVKELELFLLTLTQNSREGRTVHPEADIYAGIIRVMEAHLHQRLSVPELAKLCGMSATHLQKLFSKNVGMGVMEYFQILQMDMALKLLREGRTVKETALELGYADQNYFSTAFKRITGHVPSKFKGGSHRF